MITESVQEMFKPSLRCTLACQKIAFDLMMTLILTVLPAINLIYISTLDHITVIWLRFYY